MGNQATNARRLEWLADVRRTRKGNRNPPNMQAFLGKLRGCLPGDWIVPEYVHRNVLTTEIGGSVAYGPYSSDLLPFREGLLYSPLQGFAILYVVADVVERIARGLWWEAPALKERDIACVGAWHPTPETAIAYHKLIAVLPS